MDVENSPSEKGQAADHEQVVGSHGPGVITTVVAGTDITPDLESASTSDTGDRDRLTGWKLQFLTIAFVPLPSAPNDAKFPL